MLKFLFTAVNSDGKKITDRIEAENLGQAKYALDLRGFSLIEFHQSELNQDILNTFDDKIKKAYQNNMKDGSIYEVESQFDTSHLHYFKFLLKKSWFSWLIIIGGAIYVPNLVSIGLLVLSCVAMIYVSLPSILHKQSQLEYFKQNNSKARFWLNFLSWFNIIGFHKIPQFHIDSSLAGLDAREGNLTNALQRISKYQNDPKVSKRMFNNAFISTYGQARNYDEMLNSLENTLHEGNVYPEEMLDYAICLANRHKQTSLARKVLDKVYDLEMTAILKPFLPFCQGVIELEDGNISQAEFYLKIAANDMKPYEKNDLLIGSRIQLKAFLSIVLAKTGQREEAAKLFQESKWYLEAAQEEELLQKCEAALS